MKTLLTLFITLVLTIAVSAQSESELAKATQNPLAAMYSLPFQNNTTFCFLICIFPNSIFLAIYVLKEVLA